MRRAVCLFAAGLLLAASARAHDEARLPGDAAAVQAAAADAPFKLTVGQPARKIAGAVHPAVWLERVVEETLGAQLWAIQVAARHLHATDEQLTDYAQRHRL